MSQASALSEQAETSAAVVWWESGSAAVSAPSDGEHGVAQLGKEAACPPPTSQHVQVHTEHSSYRLSSGQPARSEPSQQTSQSSAPLDVTGQAQPSLGQAQQQPGGTARVGQGGPTAVHGNGTLAFTAAATTASPHSPPVLQRPNSEPAAALSPERHARPVATGDMLIALESRADAPLLFVASSAAPGPAGAGDGPSVAPALLSSFSDPLSAMSQQQQQEQQVRDVCGRVLVLGLAQRVQEVCKVLKHGRLAFKDEADQHALGQAAQAAQLVVGAGSDAVFPSQLGPARLQPCITAIPLTREQLSENRWKERRELSAPAFADFIAVIVAIHGSMARIDLDLFLPLLQHLRPDARRVALVFIGPDEMYLPPAGALLHTGVEQLLKADDVHGPAVFGEFGGRLLSWSWQLCHDAQVRWLRQFLADCSRTAMELTLPTLVPSIARRAEVERRYPPKEEKRALLRWVARAGAGGRNAS